MARVLLVETSETVRAMLCEAVKEAGHTVHCAVTRGEAEELLSASLFDLLISSMVLPDGSGLELAVMAADLGTSTMVIAGHPGALAVTTIAGVIHLRIPYNAAEFRNLIANQLGV